MTGIERITKERQRQLEVEGFDADHDSDHTSDQLAWAAICYAAPSPVYKIGEVGPVEFRFVDPWPADWDGDWDKRPLKADGSLKKPTMKQRIRQLEKAGALIAAEIDRLIREAQEDGKNV